MLLGLDLLYCEKHPAVQVLTRSQSCRMKDEAPAPSGAMATEPEGGDQLKSDLKAKQTTAVIDLTSPEGQTAFQAAVKSDPGLRDCRNAAERQA